MELDDLKPLLTELQNRVTASPSTTALQPMEVPLDRFTTMMAKFKLSWTLWNKKEAKEYLQEFESMKSLLNMWLTVGIWDAGEKQLAILATIIEQGQTQQEHDKAILATVTEQGRTQQERDDAAEEKEILVKEKEILNWITSLNFFQRQADVFRAWQPGTGEWLLSDATFKNWTLGSGRILWCRGIRMSSHTSSAIVLNFGEGSWGRKDCPSVGCGKSPPDSISKQCHCSGMHLPEPQGEGGATPENLLASVWKQLVVDRSLPPAAYDLYKHHHLRDTRPSLTEVFDILQSAMAQHSKVYIIVDALDEYPEEQRNILLEHLSMLQGPTTSLMMTSRPHVTLDDLFPDVLGLEIKATADDIRQYVDKQIQKSPRLSKHVQTRPELHDEIKSKISSNADGMFLLAKLHIESLATKMTIKAVREALQYLPKDLSHTYDEAMNWIKNQNDDDRYFALQALTWVAYAKRPLSVAELCEALAIEPDATTLDVDNLLDINIVLSVCAGLIIVDEAMSVVRLIHFTTQRYFDSIQPDQFADAHTMIASQCLAYLCFDEFSQLDKAYMLDKGVKAHPLVGYSQHLLLHAAGANRQLDLQPGLTFFLEKAHSWKGIWYSSQREPAPPWDYMYSDWPLNPSLLWLSAASNLIHIATHLVDQLVDDTSIDSALSAAVFYGYIEMAQLLIKKYGANVNFQGGFYGTALQAASDRGHKSVAQFLIEKGADVNAEGGYYGTALQAASLRGHESIAQFLIEKGADVNAKGGYYGTALQAASEGGHESVAQFLIEKGADVNAVGGYYGTALQAASEGGHESVARFLIEKRADVNAEGGYYGTALQAASEGGHESVAQFLIEKGAEVNAVGGYYGTALQAASRWGHESVAQFLIEKRADVNAKGGYYGTALQAASEGGHESVAQFLIEKGADVNAMGGYYGTALQAASEGGHESVAQFLIEKRADVHAQGGEYGTALQAASYRGHESVARFLIEKGADVNAVGGFYGTALQAASREGRESVARFIIDKGADVNAVGGHHGTALQAASAQGHESVAQFRIEKGADVNAMGGYDGTALQAASWRGHESVAQFLIEKGADVNAVGGYWGTALQAASCQGYESVARFLIEKGADVNAMGGHYGTALQAASGGGHESVAQFLVEKGAEVNAVGGYFGTALQAASRWGHESIAQFLIEMGADVNAQGEKYGTALQAACACVWGQERAEPVVQLLIEMGADVNAQGGKHGTALQAASRRGFETVARLLIENGAHLNQTAKDTTALWVASAKGREAVVQVLIKSGANLDLQGHYGTALQAAFAWGHESIVQLLIENGAQPVSPPERPRSAAGYIEREERKEIYDGGSIVHYTG
ncbi:ankyrin repeat-containing domain protein [Mycena latifolia]|nr:ankyrin repeat-containing domain protein [Mycena latifolia]